jgi:quercetin dioxygenase-like cupin family protein/ribosome-binding protein aMBF1 (putative translation factor)
LEIKRTTTKLSSRNKKPAVGRGDRKVVTKPSAKVRARAEAAETPREPLRIGSKLKHARLLRGYTLKELADIVECSESMLSKLENDKLASSIAFLHRLANALGTSIAELYSEEDSLSGPVHVFHADRRGPGVADPEAPGQGVRFERIVPIDRNGLLQALVHSIPPGARSGGTVTHIGEELGYIIEGEVEVTVDGKSYVVRQGDMIFFPSSLPHGYYNKGDKTARMLKVNTPPSL